MRKLLAPLIAAVALAGAVSPVAAQSAPTKIAFVNSQRLMAEAPGMQEAQRAFEREMQGFQAELGRLEEQITQMIGDFEQKQATMTADARKRQEDAILQKQREGQQRASQLEQQAARRRQELLEPVMKRIETAVDEIRQQGSYNLILDASSGVVLSADTSLDLTEQVLTRLKATASAAPTRR